MTRNLLCSPMLAAALAGLAGCSSVSQRAEERRPFFQQEYDFTSHGRKTLFDRVVELDPGGVHVKVAPDYQQNAPLKIAVLPFTDRGSANFVVDKIPLTFRDRQERARWAWTDAQRLRRSMVGYLSEREFFVLNPRHRRGTALGRGGLPRARAAHSGLRESAASDRLAGARDRRSE